MGRCVLKIEHDNKTHYMVWSSIVDAPIFYDMCRQEVINYWKNERLHDAEIDMRLKLLDEKGCSSLGDVTLDQVLAYNRAGDKEECLTKEEIIKKFCINNKT